MYFSGLEKNLPKSEIVDVGALEGVQVAVCGMHCIDLNTDRLKILGTHFSYNKKLKDKTNLYNIVTDLQLVMKICKTRKLPLEGNIVIFKTIVISKIVFRAFIRTGPKHCQWT